MSARVSCSLVSQLQCWQIAESEYSIRPPMSATATHTNKSVTSSVDTHISYKFHSFSSVNHLCMFIGHLFSPFVLLVPVHRTPVHRILNSLFLRDGDLFVLCFGLRPLTTFDSVCM